MKKKLLNKRTIAITAIFIISVVFSSIALSLSVKTIDKALFIGLLVVAVSLYGTFMYLTIKD